MTNEENWHDSLNEVKKYIDEYNKKPSEHIGDKKTLGRWIKTQISNYKNKINE